MTTLQQHVQEYLQLRQALGHKLAYATRYLPSFVAYLDAQELATVTTASAVAWAQATPRRPASPRAQYDRLAVVRGFARYMMGVDQRTEIPPRTLFVYRPERRTPFIYSVDDIRALMASAQSTSGKPFRGTTLATIIGLLGVTGMRVGEALRLTLADVDWRSGSLTIRETKFGKSRAVILEPSTLSALQTYVTMSQTQSPRPATGCLFVTEQGRPMTYTVVSRAFQRSVRSLDLGQEENIHPRLHDLRHAFAVRTLIGWHQRGVDVEAWLPRLSTYLGHTHPQDTYWYLLAVPDLLQAAARRVSAWQEVSTP